MKNLISISIILMFLLLVSCNSNNGAKKISRIDSLSTILNQLKAKMKNEELSNYKLLYNTVRANNQFFKENLTTLPNDTSFTNAFTMYGMIDKTFKRYFKNLEKYEEEIKLSEKQLTNLKNDVKNKLLTKEEFEKYFKEELAAIFKLENEIKTSESTTAQYKKEYNKIHIRIETFKDSLANTIKSK